MKFAALWKTAVAALVMVPSLAGTAPAEQSHDVSAELVAQSCSSARYIYLPDKRHRVVSMSYIECHRSNDGVRQSSTALWLWDNRDGDGLCATATVRIGGWAHNWSWCNATRHSPKLISG